MELSHIQSLAKRVESALSEGLNEANTRTSLVLPFLSALGYDVFDHTEVALEYTADWGTKKGEKIDIAVLKNGEPIILIECKALGEPLDEKKCTQLFRYFSTLPARIGVLTDGQKYLFFSDIEKQNIMDTKPFMEFDLLRFNERCLPELSKLAKQSWNLEGVLSTAETLKYVLAIKSVIAEELADPSDVAVKHYASLCYGGKMTSRIIDIFRPIVKRAFSEHISDLIAKRLDSVRQVAEENETRTPIQHEPELQRLDAMPPQVGENGIITYNTEVWAYVIVRTLLRDIVDPARIAMRDQKSYCSILLDDNNRKPICRLFNFQHFEWGMENIGDNASILILTESNDKGEKHRLRYVDDIYPLVGALETAVRRLEARS